MDQQLTISNLTWIFLKTTTRQGEPSRANRTRVAKIDNGWLLKSMHFHGSDSSLTTQAMIFYS